MSIRKLAINIIKVNIVRDNLQTMLNDRLGDFLVSTVEEKWNAFKSIMYKVSKEKFNTAVKKHEYWFDGTWENLTGT